MGVALVCLAILATGAIAEAGSAASDWSRSNVVLQVTRGPAVAGKPMSYQVQLANNARGTSPVKTLPNVVLTMNLPHQSMLSQYSTISGTGDPSTYPRRFTVSGPAAAIVVDWAVGKIAPQNYYTLAFYTKVAPDAGSRLCGVSFTVTVGGKFGARKAFACQAVRPR
jgi:hypothetical protein